MGDFQAGLSMNVFLLGGITILLCVVIHFIYKTIFSDKKREASFITESDSGAQVDNTASESVVTENRPSGKSKKRAPWKGKTEFNHPWLFKNLKGHPGNILHMDFSANGKFMAATCDANIFYEFMH
ncbi:unnamed protein product [Parnassius apollo]|uniref:(apollo) hypothetical protein n=1 Tax=Parnassius apollo TaxID=110799 RepID=A0A8S3XY03_PARAO|nr:unnamed protein product [Parnassius apollo]